MKIGVLCLQGAFIEHINMLEKLGANCLSIRQKKHIQKDIDAIVLPGGESTTIGKLLVDLDMKDDIIKLINGGMPVFGTCAGLLLLAKGIKNDDRRHLSTMNILAKRNAYGRQQASFDTTGEFNKKEIPMTFIRAPYVEEVYNGVDILAKVDGRIVAVREKNQLATSFHPELTNNTYVHEYFINMIKNKK